MTGVAWLFFGGWVAMTLLFLAAMRDSRQNHRRFMLVVNAVLADRDYSSRAWAILDEALR